MAYFAEKDFFEDPELIELTQKVFSGELQLGWYNATTEKVRCEPHDVTRGFTYDDCNVGSYGFDGIPEFLRRNYSMAARGSQIVPGLPDLGYTLNRKSDVWSDNVAALYEESKARRWVPATDIPWAELRTLAIADDLNIAMSQLCTTLEEIALVIMEVPSRWVFSINQEFLELKSYLCAQMIDQARHVEVFRKRALAGGKGLKRASATIEQALKEILFAETYPEASLVCNVMLNSLVLAVLRHVAAVAPTAIDTRLFRLAAQDTAREIAYGTAQLRYHLRHQPHQAAFLHDYLDRSEHTFAGIAGSAELLEPLIILSGGGTSRDAIQRGSARVRWLYQLASREYLERLAAAGLDRRERSRLPKFFGA
ncbi:MAG TPA: hypothetical protein VL403_06790 [Candidatus Kryptonia bacterium]|nr:hypothetical protein [Candidatus Kryptonia bacterium]